MTETLLLPDPEAEMDSVQIGELSLSFRAADGGGKHYLGRTHVEEYHSPLYPLIHQALVPRACIDVGANYGYTGLLMRRAFPDATLTLVEPIPWLADYIAYNFTRNGQRFEKFHSAIVSDETSAAATFGIKSKASQDSRVVAQDGGPTIATRSITLDQLAEGLSDTDGVYIKIDTQGWEEHVFASGAAFLGDHNRWFVKTEFAPMWLESQQSDPVVFLSELTRRYDVYESPGRAPWASPDLDQLLGQQIESRDAATFTTYVRNLARNDLGWVDLFVLPPMARRAYKTNTL